MRKLLFPAIAMAMLTACAGDDADSPDTTSVVAPESAGATSLEDCSNVSLSTTRINAAARTTVNTELTFDNALAVWRMPVSEGQELTAEMTVPDDKDYNIAFFDGSGNKLACADTEGNGVDETLEYTVASISEIWVKVWTPALPSRSAFTLTMVAPVATEITEDEPNDTPATAQVVSESFTTVDGTLDTDNSDADDYYKYAVTEGDLVTINASATDDGASLIYVALVDSDDTILEENNEPVEHYFGENEMTASLTYTVPAATTEVYVWMAAIPGTGTYSLQVRIQ
jgi:hypothetical protein